MNIEETEQSSAVILHLKGELLGGQSAQNFKNRLKELIDSGKKQVIVDLTKTTYINSSGIGMLVSGLTTLSQANGSLKLVGIEENIRNIFVITNLVSVFECYKTIQEAINS